MIFGTDRNRVGTVRDRALTQRDRILRGCLCALAKGGRILARCGCIVANSHGAIRAITHSPANIAAALTFITAVLTFITAVLLFITAILAAATTASDALLYRANILRVFGHLGREAGDIFQALGQYVVDTDQCSADIVKVFVADEISRRMDRTVFIDRRAAAQCREDAAQLTDVDSILILGTVLQFGNFVVI